VKLDLIRLGEQLAEENNTALDLWSWLPSHAIAVEHHGDYASEHRPSNRDVMMEASMYLAHLRRPEDALTTEERKWFTSCPCGEDHEQP
jgi:hypothetical protein